MAMNKKLPSGWVETELENLVSPSGVFSDGDWVESKDQDPEGDVRLVQLADIGEMLFLNKSARFMASDRAEQMKCLYLQKNDILISRLGDPLGKACLYPAAEAKAVTAVDVCVFRPGHEYLDPKLVGHFLNSISLRNLINRQASGTTRKRITGNKLKSLPFRLPPLSEQKRIVSKIEELFSDLDEGEANLKRVQKLLARYRQSVLKAAVTGELTKNWRTANKHRLESGEALLQRILQTRRQQWQGKGKYQEPPAPDMSNLHELPGGWVWVTPPHLGYFGRGKSKHRPRNDPKLFKDGIYPFLQTGTIRNSNGRIRTYDTLYNELGLKQSRLWPSGTVCITIAANIAESGILEIEACFPDSVVGLVPDEMIVGRYVELFIRTAKANLERYAPATAQKNINLDILEKVAIPLPPLLECEEIVSQIEAIFSRIAALENYCQTELARSTALRQSILKDAFSGKLVPQDPTDEPASELLKRIQTEWEKQPVEKTQRSRRKEQPTLWESA